MINGYYLKILNKKIICNLKENCKLKLTLFIYLFFFFLLLVVWLRDRDISNGSQGKNMHG